MLQASEDQDRREQVRGFLSSPGTTARAGAELGLTPLGSLWAQSPQAKALLPASCERPGTVGSCGSHCWEQVPGVSLGQAGVL